MKLVSTTEDPYIFPPSYFGLGQAARITEVVSPRITQISSDEASLGGIAPRTDSFRSVYVSDPFVVVSVRLMHKTGMVEDSTFLRNIQLSSSITTFDTFTAGGQATSVDTYNLDSQCLASMGRFSFDLENYATSQIVLKAINRTVFDLIMVVKIEVYSKSENNHYVNNDNKSGTPSNVYSMKTTDKRTGNRRSK
jgi:hypothetical protein